MTGSRERPDPRRRWSAAISDSQNMSAPALCKATLEKYRDRGIMGGGRDGGAVVLQPVAARSLLMIRGPRRSLLQPKFSITRRVICDGSFKALKLEASEAPYNFRVGKKSEIYNVSPK